MKSKGHKKTKIWSTEILAKSIPALITLLAVIIGIYKYNVQKSYESNMEFNRNLYENRIVAFEEMGELVGKIVLSAQNNDDSLFLETSESFSILHLKLIPLIIDDDVDVAMSVFINDIDDFKDQIIPYEEFHNCGYILLKECQKSLQKCYWDLNTGKKLAYLEGADKFLNQMQPE